MAKEKKGQLACRPEAIDLLQKIRKIQTERKGQLLHEPYFPYVQDLDLNSTSWGISFEEIERINPILIGTRQRSIYLDDPPSFFDDVRKEGWAEKQKFYKSILDKNQFTTPSGKTYELIHKDSCQFKLWALK